MTSKIDVRMILTDHFDTFRDEATGKVSYPDYILMVGVPALAALILLLLGVQIGDRVVGTLVSVFAIFAGLLFNVQVLMYSFSDDESTKNKSIRDRLLHQSFANISYAIVVSLLVVFLLTAILFVDGIPQRIVDTLIVFFATNFFLSLLMVLKRMHVLLRAKFGG
ncbi:hypothetical protein [Mesorhizobium sp.]|uniref:hypothetical protein n=1 Tax=Mesorhizobium sp. TaxID=1871066 RepID=UPI0012051394|nr:hypothetical protein [Mesorhizobium sp.]TIP39513.1 MAG: hypothetical protein E5X62_31110 [Mesorhizobium sp.]